MTTVAMNSTQQVRLQNEVQNELERREWAEPGDNVMAEYVTVLIANGSSRDRVLTEMDDLVGTDFDSRFLDWLFDTASEIQRENEVAPVQPVSQPTHAPASNYQANSRILTSALASTREDSNKRKADYQGEASHKKRLSDLPSGPRAMADGRNLQDRMGPKTPMMQQQRGFSGGRGGGMGGSFQPGFQPQQQMMPGFGFFPQQQEMMAQMMMMQSSMAQMGQMMQKMAEEKEAAPQAPVAGYGTVPDSSSRPAPVRVPHGTKLGSHTVSTIKPKASSTGPIPTKPSSKALCKYSVGCSNSRCIYSHPSPVADEKTGMVLSDEPCEAGKDCKDAECTKSHVSPAAALGGVAGPARLLCKYQNCTNPACPFRHEDAEGKAIPPPALSAPREKNAVKPAEVAPSSDNEDGEDVEVVMTHRGLLDGPLDDTKAVTVCRYGERCTRLDCKFSHPASRVTPKSRGSYNPRGGAHRSLVTTDRVASNGMAKSKKFGEKLNPGAGAFVPKEAGSEVATS